MKTFLNANAFVTFMLLLAMLINVAFSIEGGEPMSEYMSTVFIALGVEIAFWLLCGIGYLVWWAGKLNDRRRLGILRYDGQRGEWYYQR